MLVSFSSKFCSTRLVIERSSAMPPPISSTAIQPEAISTMRRARLTCARTDSTASLSAGPGAGSEPKSLGPGSVCRVVEAVSKSTDGRNHVCAEFLADAGDENLDRVRIAVKILIVDMLDQLGAADHLALVVHEIGEQLVRSEE